MPGLGFAVLVKRDEGFFEIFIVFGVVVYCHKGFLYSIDPRDRCILYQTIL